MKTSKLFGSLLTAMALMVSTVFTQVPVRADALRVVTLGADLSDDEKSKMLSYFKVNKNEVRIIYVTNKDERERLGGFIPLEQIGSRTVSCAYVRPTTSGGIKVRTANLNYVTGNMIASSLSTSGVSNCEVVAACPFEVSGTGALTGVLMAYEVASGTTLDSTKKEIATQEIITTANLADQVGEQQAVNVVNKAKTEIIANNIQDADEIYNTVINIINENGVQISSEELDEIVALLEQIAAQNYDYADMQETLSMVDHNVSGMAEESGEDIHFVSEGDGSQEQDVEDSDSIISGLDEDVLGEDVITSSTAFEDQEAMAGVAEDMGDPIDEWETFDVEGLPVSMEENQAIDDSPINDEDFNTGVADDVQQLDIESMSENGMNMDNADDTLSIAEGDDSVFDETDEPVSVETEDDTESAEEGEAEEDSSVEEEGEAEEDTQEWDVTSLDSVSQGQFKSAKSFVEKSYTTKSCASLDSAAAKSLVNYVLGEYFDILSGNSSYTSTRQAFFSDELNIVDQMLMETFGAEGETMSDAASKFLSKLSTTEAQTLYKSSIAYFATLYGESAGTESAESSEEVWEDVDSLEDDVLEESVTDEEMVWD